MSAAGAYGLPKDPLAAAPKQALVETAMAEVCRVGAATRAEVAQVLPPVYELLP